MNFNLKMRLQSLQMEHEMLSIYALAYFNIIDDPLDFYFSVSNLKMGLL